MTAYAKVGDQFWWGTGLEEEHYVFVIAVPTGWLISIEVEANKVFPYQLVPDKDHTTNPRAFCPPGWQDGIEDCGQVSRQQIHANERWKASKNSGQPNGDEEIMAEVLYDYLKKKPGKAIQAIGHGKNMVKISRQGLDFLLTIEQL